ncbi:hypothetical protein Nepgr_015179 [Nepenthes gracilis]|uniref:PCI domain-containing protein n=1 Tax=Nepenthes gracilis TaxID=150966 RepID=A0AAD3SKS5_NEPGR|nr:hypothetical protein Nepgr_015179 [Nepenthes gracilis]
MYAALVFRLFRFSSFWDFFSALLLKDVKEMMSQGESAADTVAPADPSSFEKHQLDVSQGQTISYYHPTAGPAAASWPAHGADNCSIDHASLSNFSYQHDQQLKMHSRNVQDGSNAVTLGFSSSKSGPDNGSQVYTGYASYPTSTNPYGYGSTEYQVYYNGYQQQSTQPVGVYNNHNTGAPYQPLSSFQNTGSYAGPTGYSSTYYNPGDYQTSEAYAGSNYSNQTNLWSQGNYTNYTQQYGNHTQDSNTAYSSNSVAACTLNYQQQVKQWADYYSQTEVSCAPGTENTTVTSNPTLACPIPSVSGGYAASTIQAQPSYTPPWRPESGTSASPSVQTAMAIGAHDGYWKHGSGTQGFQNHHVIISQPNFQNSSETQPSYPAVQEPQHSALIQGPTSQYSDTHQVPHTCQQLLQPPVSTDTRRVSKLQIPTNPRIASNLALGLLKNDKDSSATTAAAKPAYISVPFPKPNDKLLSGDASDSVLKKPVMFPASLRGYVERALARCKDERQMAACQDVMKEMISKATADGTVHTRDWDTEPLFPLPYTCEVNEESLHGAAPAFSLPKLKRSPSRRSKSRWEPLPEEKSTNKPASSSQDSVKYGGWIDFNGRDEKFTSGKSEGKHCGGDKFSMLGLTSASKCVQRPFKKMHFGDGLNTAEDGDASSDSDKEQGLTAYYSGAIALANSTEERKRRESRSKRFEKGNGQRADINRSRMKSTGSGSLYATRASALVLSKAFEDSSSRAVEDIDWDALTLKGTSQELEKCYLRLTSAPDPATVRPEEVLERSLHMVQNSQKNYLYKCDQLKSIRQDLTVQRIRNELTVKVYETHARLALEFGDLPEYNQCQSQLKSLYAEGIAGSHMEFSAYNLLGVILHSNNRRDLLSSMSRLSDEAKRDEAVKHALAVRAAVTSGNYVLFFRLYKTAPNLNTCLMDLYVEKMRFEAVKCISRAYRPTVPVSYIAQILGFSSLRAIEGDEEKDADGLEECPDWLKIHGACLITDNNGEMQLDAKASSSSLYMPEPEDAVTHGDIHLAVNDFLTRTTI